MIRNIVKKVCVVSNIAIVATMISIGYTADAEPNDYKDIIDETVKEVVDQRDTSPRPKLRPWTAETFKYVHKNINCENYRRNELVSLACNIYFEGRGETVEGRYAIAHVTMNRVEDSRYPSSVSRVVWQRKGRVSQFEWTLDGKSDKIRNKAAWADSLKVAYDVINNRHKDNTAGSTHYHADWMTPYWAKTLDKKGKIGKHIFYKW
mgnify:CR=1 FL=1